MNKDELSRKLDELNEMADNCDDTTPVTALYMGRDIALAYDDKEITLMEQDKIFRNAFKATLRFKNNCSCK